MGRWQAAVTALVLLIAAFPAVGQQGYDMSGGRPAVDQPEGSAEQLHEDVLLLRAIRTLDLSADQRDRLVAINRDLADEREDLVALRESTWEDHQDDIEAVLEAWTEGEAPSGRDVRAADRAVNDVEEARAEYNEAVREAAEEFVGILSEDQLNLIEGPAQADRRMAREARMGGLTSPGEWVLIQLDAIRDLMPDEFQLLAQAEARRMARAIFGPDAANLEQASERMLEILTYVRSWTAEEYRQQRERLPAEIEAILGVQGLAQRPPVVWSEVLRLVRSTRTTSVIVKLSVAGGGEEQ